MNKSKAVEILSKIISPTYHDYVALHQIVQMDDEEWEEIVKVANRHMLIPVLYMSLKEKECLPLIKSEQLQGFLAEMYRLNSFRNEKILEQIREICDLMYKNLGIEVVLLKGVAALSESHYSTIGERSMMDIDILVPEEKIYEAISLMKEYGYSEIDDVAYDPEGHWHHYNRLYNRDKIASLEIHRYALSTKSNFVDILDKKYLSKSISIPHTYVIEPTYEIIHSFLHTQISHSYHKNKFLALRQLHHVSVLFQKHKSDIDFQLIEHYMKTSQLFDIWSEYLYLLKELFILEDTVLVGSREKGRSYFNALNSYLDTSHTNFAKGVAVLHRIEETFNSKFLMQKYKYNNKVLTPLFISIHIPVVLLKFLFNQKIRKNFFIQIRTMTS